VLGDLPFMISGNSDDVWRWQEQFDLRPPSGAPPDAFAADGQDWGLPPWRWEVMAASDFAWMRQRARRMANLFAGFRLDHLVGLYRAWVRPLDPSRPPFFNPADEATQLTLGESLVRIFTGTGAEIIAEDLGTVPPFVRDLDHRARRARLQGPALGAPVERTRPPLRSIPRPSRSCRWPPPAPTTSNPSPPSSSPTSSTGP
jgi:4-alpha-glucanotransferase